MCMIAYRPAKAGNIPNAVIDTAIGRHGDGFGIAYRDAKEGLVTLKYGPSERKAFRRALKRVDRSGAEYVAHFRWATHGAKDAAHAHPYEYKHPEDGRVLVFHNGVIDIRTEGAESDTQVFVRDVLATLPSRWWTHAAMRWLVTEAIGWSKLVIMTADETYNMHDARGEWDNGLWYSSDHKPSKVYSYSSTTDDDKWTARGWSKDAKTGQWAAPSRLSSAIITATTGKYPAARSAAVIGLLEPGAPIWTSEENENGSCPRIVDGPTHFRHGGHNLTPIADIRLDAGDADYEDAVICDTCSTVGTVYVIDGTYYVDMMHVSADDSEERLPGTIANLRAN